MRNSNTDILQKAKNYAFLLLKFRLRSEKEIAQRLKQKGFAQGTIEQVVSFLREKQFLDDKIFARTWIESRLKRPFGIRRIKEELKIKGVAPQTISEEWGQLRDKYPEEQIVFEIARQKFSKLRNIDKVKAKSRIYGYLLRRGFSAELVMDAINKL